MIDRIKVPSTLHSSFEAYGADEKLDMASVYAFYTAKNYTHLLDTPNLSKKRGDLAILLPYYLEELRKINEASFAFLLKEEQHHLLNQLRYTFFLVYSQYQLDKVEGRTHLLEKHKARMDHCIHLIQQLDTSAALDQEASLEDINQAQIDMANKSAKFLGWAFAQILVEKIQGLFDKVQQYNKTDILRTFLSDINDHRLYWVWCGGLLNTLLTIWPDDFFNKQQTKLGINSIAPITGYMSWVLYYTRFGINLSLLLKHTFGPLIVNCEESKIPLWERFTTQWEQRKYALLNDSIWATANMTCFFWLFGSGALGYAGNVVTLSLLFMDLTLSTFQFWEESTRHNKKIAEFEAKREKLKQESAALLANNPENEKKIIELKAQLKHLDKLQVKTETDFSYYRAELINTWVYSLGLMTAFAIMCTLFVPAALMAPPAAMLIALGGAALCFVFTIGYAAIKGGISIAKVRQETLLLKLEKILLEKKFKESNDDNEQKRLYMELERLENDIQHQQHVIYFKGVHLMRSVLIDALVPVIVFSSFMFMPLGIGLAVLAAGLAIAVISNIIINRFEPKQKALPTFNNRDETFFNQYRKKPDAKHFERKALQNNNKKSERLFHEDETIEPTFEIIVNTQYPGTK